MFHVLEILPAPLAMKKELIKLVSDLFQLGVPASITMEDLPVEDTMRSFFKNPEKFLK